MNTNQGNLKTGNGNKRVYIDVNVFLNPVLYNIDENPETARADLFLKKIINKEIEAYTSLLTWDEFVWIIRKNFGVEIAGEKGKDFLIFPNLIFDSITYDLINKAQNFIASYSLKPRDAIHLASAIQRKITEIITFDDDFKGIPIIFYHPP